MMCASVVRSRTNNVLTQTEGILVVLRRDLKIFEKINGQIEPYTWKPSI
jgi:hypothetical protein